MENFKGKRASEKIGKNLPEFLLELLDLALFCLLVYLRSRPRWLYASTVELKPAFIELDLSRVD